MECLQADTFDSHKESRLTLKLKNFKLNTTEEENIEFAKIKEEREESKFSRFWSNAIHIFNQKKNKKKYISKI